MLYHLIVHVADLSYMYTCILKDSSTGIIIVFLCTDKWESREKPHSIYNTRQDSSTSRLNSFNSLASLDSRKDSFSSHTISPPGNQQCSRSSTPITPVTPSSTYSPMLGISHQTSTPVFPTADCSPSFQRSNSTTNASYQAVVTMDLSSSSSSINSDIPHHHVDQSPLPPPVSSPFLLNNLRQIRKKGHIRSHSNPPSNIIMPEVVPEHTVPDYRSPSPSSPNPPSRSGSNPSITQNNVVSSPSAKTHPQMRKLIGIKNPSNSFNRSYSTDLGGGDDLHPVEPPILRSNSEASNSSPRQRRLSKEVGTSTSMVDLPLIQCSTDQYYYSEYSLPSTGKSYSVPRLANLVTNGENGGMYNKYTILVQ